MTGCRVAFLAPMAVPVPAPPAFAWPSTPRPTLDALRAAGFDVRTSNHAEAMT